MSLKDITADLHEAAEETPFMKAIFEQKLPLSVWQEWTYWRILFYSLIEQNCEAAGLLDGIKDIKRTKLLLDDYLQMQGDYTPSEDCRNPALVEYEDYLSTITPQQALAHLYVWHMGDLFGGQMIKKVMTAPSHHALEFKDAATLKVNLRTKLTDDLGPEARTAFEFAIKMLNAVYHE